MRTTVGWVLLAMMAGCGGRSLKGGGKDAGREAASTILDVGRDLAVTPDAPTTLDAPATPDGPKQPGECAGLGPCECLAAGDRCNPISTACWCPFPDCNPNAACACGGGSFLGCQAKSCPAASCGIGGLGSSDVNGCRACEAQPDCSTALARVNAACAGQAFVGAFVTGACKSNPSCEAACMAKLGSCAEIGCSFCVACDCVGTPTPFTRCLMACGTAS